MHFTNIADINGFSQGFSDLIFTVLCNRIELFLLFGHNQDIIQRPETIGNCLFLFCPLSPFAIHQ